MSVRDALVAAVGRDVRLSFDDGTEAFALLRAVDGAHALVRFRGDRHPTRVRIELLSGVQVTADETAAPATQVRS